MSCNSSVENRAVYTALIGDYDQLTPISFSSRLKFILFTDQVDLFVKGWETRNISDLPNLPKDMPHWMINRYLKVHPHVFLSEFKETLYVDANIHLVQDPTPLFTTLLCNYDIAIPLHMDRDSIFTELDECLRTGKIGKDDWKVMALRLDFYRSQGMPNRHMTENNVIFRRDSCAVRHTMNIWWDEINLGMKRDQLALPYAAYKAGLTIHSVDNGPRRSGKFMTIRPHWPAQKRKNMRYFARAISALRHRSRIHMFAAKVVDTLVALISHISRKRA
jgi:hypothetical protein